MVSHFNLLLLLLLLASSKSWLLTEASSTTNQIPKHYVVYMGSSPNYDHVNEEDEAREAEKVSHLQLLSTVIPSQENERVSLLHHYSHALKGFSAMLTQKEASILSGKSGIVSVFRDPSLKLHTTRSWDFLESELGIRPSPYAHNHHHHESSDVIIGMIDTGIWPESPSFKDHGMGEIPARWKGVCMAGPDFEKSSCNRKLIGARYYSIQPSQTNHTYTTESFGSPRDAQGHGTHTASIAAGAAVANASYYNLAKGTARGGSPSTRLAVYKACLGQDCSGSTILKAIDDAIKDGVDIISVSIGTSSVFQADYLNDPIAIGAFHAEEKGVLVISSGGNDGPYPSTVVNSAPWIVTVAASNIDRGFQSSVVLGNGNIFQGSGINFSNLTRSKTYPLVFGKDAASEFTPIAEARNCYPGSLDESKVKGKIVVCENDFTMASRQIKKLVAEDAGAKGLILLNEDDKDVPLDSGIFPFAQVGDSAGFQILHYINSSKNPTAMILPTIEVPKYKPSPMVAFFSSRGPAILTENILKPDIMAPGVAILGAAMPSKSEDSGRIPFGKRVSEFAIKSGTSMACPHVTGAAAFVKSIRRQWTSSMIKSALMTTATAYNNEKKPVTNNTNMSANPHEIGVGEISPIRALNPGLVFETTTQDYLNFLCYYGYPEENIKSMSNTNFNCPKTRTESLISDLNYPTISISKLERHQKMPTTIRRTVTNVGGVNATYVTRVRAPRGLVVSVVPSKIVFSKSVRKASYDVSFYGKEADIGYNFGTVVWVDGKHYVRTVFAVNVD